MFVLLHKHFFSNAKYQRPKTFQHNFWICFTINYVGMKAITGGKKCMIIAVYAQMSFCRPLLENLHYTVETDLHFVCNLM